MGSRVSLRPAHAQVQFPLQPSSSTTPTCTPSITPYFRVAHRIPLLEQSGPGKPADLDSGQPGGLDEADIKATTTSFGTKDGTSGEYGTEPATGR